MPYVISTFPEPTMAPGFAKSRLAVATLDEARESARRVVVERIGADADWQFETARIPESGGSVGPLPDGTLIEVKQVGWPAIADEAGFVWEDSLNYPEGHAEILATFNAAQAVA